MYLFVWSTLTVAVFLGYRRDAQPICRDLNAPFEYAEATYCPEYSGYGCCGKREERRAEKWEENGRFKLNSTEKEVCNDYLRNVSCLTCSPLAGRIFHSANSSNDRIPLCFEYCVEVYVKCRLALLRMFKLHPWREELVAKFPESSEELNRDAVTFCERYSSDLPHCYPEVTAMEREFTDPPESTNFVCAVPIASGLRQALAAVGAGDNSGRLFIMEQPGIVRILEQRKINVEHE